MCFQLVTSFQCKDFNLVSANKVINQPKNRMMTIVPVESSRVHLTPKPGEEGSDYINATWIQGFHSLREFIITQHPLKHTVKDFWQMVWDHNAQTIVMLSIIDNQVSYFILLDRFLMAFVRISRYFGQTPKKTSKLRTSGSSW